MSGSADLNIVPVIGLSLEPNNGSIEVGSTEQFTAFVTGTSDNDVTWSVSGPNCTSATCGTVTNSGLYTAPATGSSTQSVTIEATSVADPTKSGSAEVTVKPPAGISYYLAPAASGGNDANNGLSPNSPWLTPAHPVNCGDTIIAALSDSYSPFSFGSGVAWGRVNCPAGNNVAWLKCAAFDGCKIKSTAIAAAVQINSSYWGIQGFEVTASGTYAGCFAATPLTKSANIHHIVFANDIANSCSGGGIGTFNNGRASVDYTAVVGNVVYNAAQSGSECYSGISIYQPVQTDSLPGTHIYVAGNLSYRNLDPSICAGGTSTDGEGIIFDTWDGSQGKLPSPYSAQGLAENNVLIANGGRGFEAANNKEGPANAPIYFRYNTVWGNNTDTNQNGTYCGEVLFAWARNVRAEFNVVEPKAATGCGRNLLYAFFVGAGDSSDVVDYNIGYNASGNNGGLNNSDGFSYGSHNIFGTNPGFADPVAPAAPNCQSFSNASGCIAATINSFQTQAAPVSGWGYQPVSASQTYDPLFPQWLCNVNLPSGLVTMGCEKQ